VYVHCTPNVDGSNPGRGRRADADGARAQARNLSAFCCGSAWTDGAPGTGQAFSTRRDALDPKSTLGGVLARAGLGVLVLEREARYRDRIRGEGTWPWRVAEARQAGLTDLLDAAGTVEMRAFKRYENGQPVETEWEQPSAHDVPGMGFLHPRFQEAAFSWAEAQGATAIRPAKATTFSRNGRPSLRVAVDGGKTEFTARLREGHERAFQHDPTLGGFSSIEVSGPAGLVADDAARRRYFGEDLS
jgi:hypothetical protein